MRTTTSLSLTALALAGAVVLAGCSGSSGDTATPSPSPTTTSSPAPTPSSTPTPAPTPGAGATDPAPADGATGDPAASGDAPRCTQADLTGSTALPTEGGGAGASQLHVDLVLTNASGASCTLQGWPGVSFVGGGDGTQLGVPAVLDRDTEHPTVTLAPGASASAPLHYTQAGVFPDAECGMTPADGLRVYPPGSTASLFVAWPQAACSTRDHALLDVGGFVPAS